ncbi:hypothetical protein M8998_03845 [Sphingobacterium sp. lm-10]|uniref:hypothetical protein n=1 Tax=Sphingobacterium sp. lm-10 TaxID=2944904 RepID=UPI00202152B5|nr:hypothetical protein [Sphingobacterium sp. lm-10]MCL7987071.1 hypothetical protein [Sphingobacterium sp. lm-10]
MMVRFTVLLVVLLQLSITHAQETMLPEVLDVAHIRFDGKLARFFSVSEFEAHYQQADSTALLIDLQPCSYVFEYADGSKDADDEYWYKDGSRFERSQEKLAVDEFRFTNDHFILYTDLRLDASTTLADLAIHFPNAVQAMGELDVQGEGKMQMLIFREDEENISDGHIRLFLKDGKLSFIHWWFPC